MAIALKAEEQELLREEVSALIRALPDEVVQERYAPLAAGVEAGELPDETLEAAGELLELGLQSGRIRRQHRANGEQALLRLFNQTPAGRALSEQTADVNRALAQLDGQEIESVRLLTRLNVLDNVMPWFAQSRDAADGVLSWQNGAMTMDWNIAASRPTIDAVVQTHTKLATAAHGLPLVPFTWTVTHDLITPHPLGGARMGTDATNGVVNHMGEVFGHRNLFVTDGAIVPKAIGLNPSRTIGALAERAAKLIADDGR